MQRQSRRKAVVSAVAALALVSGTVVAVAATNPDLEQIRAEIAAGLSADKDKAPKAAGYEVSVSDGETGVSPVEPVTVSPEGGRLRDVTLTNEEGREVKHETTGDGTWRTAEPLGYGRSYSLKITDQEGETEKVSFTTVAPDYTAEPTIAIADGSVVGGGQAVPFSFDAVPGDHRAAEKALSVTTDTGVEGAFYWISPTEVLWRAKEPLPAGTTVTAKADTYGKNFGGGIYGGDNVAATFEVGDSNYSVVDDATKTMTVYQNGEELRTIPISLGTDNSWRSTPNGTYVVGEKRESMVMDSETFGLSLDDGGYRTPVKWATQLSYSGIWVHGAPWAQWALGNTNQSHGCINMTDADAQWFQSISKRGDLVYVKNTTADQLPGSDGLGYWNIPWEQWKAGNAEQFDA